MNSNKISNIIVILLLIASFNCLALGTISYSLEDKIVNFKYSDTLEYTNITKGLSIINSLPIYFNIVNEYFSGFDHLSNEKRESIIMAYLVKNKIYTYTCGNGKDICIDKSNLKIEKLPKLFNTKTEFNSNNIKLYVDDYGNHTINTTSNLNYYRLVLDDDNHKYRKYTKFARYTEKNDIYIFYVYEGYYIGNCKKGEKLELFDFMTGEIVYTNHCNDNKEFETNPKEEINNLQLYKYELKKNEDGEFYLYGYNPVNQ